MPTSDSKRLIAQALKNKKRPVKWPHQMQPRAIERSYQRDLHQIISFMKEAVNKTLVQNLEKIMIRANAQRPENARQDDAGDAASMAKGLIDQAKNMVAQEYTDAEIARIAKKKGVSVAEFNKEQMQRNLKRVTGVDIIMTEPYLAGELELFTIGNVNLIKSIPQKTFNEIENIVFSGITTGERWENLADDIEERFDVSESRANLIARDQVSKLNGQLTQMRQTELGVSKYIWRTSLDERVRDSHRAKEGQEYDWSNPPADTGHPGQDFQCRCTPEPVLDELIES